VTLPDDPQSRFRPELPPVPRERAPIGYRPGWQIEERLQGLLLVLVGFVGLLGVYAIVSLGNLPGAPTPPPPPPGLRGLPTVPIVSFTTCFVPLIGLGSVGLIVVGFRRIVAP
jgi:hypothetical protein